MANAVSVTYKGPLFQGQAPVIIRDAIQAAGQDLVEMGEQRLDRILRPRPGGVYLSVSQAQKGQASTGHYRRNVQGVWHGTWGQISDGNVVYGPWLEGIGSRNQTTRFKGYASFRRTGDWLQKQVSKVVGHHVNRLAQRLNG